MNKNIKLGAISALFGAAITIPTYMMISGSDENDLFKNHMWVDSMPRGDTDIFNIVAFIDETGNDDGGVAVNINTSQWRLERDLFIWELDDEQISMFFPQYNDSAHVAYKVYECKSVEPFELCMNLSENGRIKQTLYSRRDWVIESADSINKDMVESFIDEVK